MTLLRDPTDCGRLRRAVHIYREKRSIDHLAGHPTLGPARTPRWACWQIAWRQSRGL